MNQNIRESDWKVFRSLHPVALDRFCQRIIEEAIAIANDSARTHHERYLALYQSIKERDKDVARMFDEMSRSRAEGLVTNEELSRFTPELQQWLRRVGGNEMMR